MAIVLRGVAFSGVSSLKSDPNAVYVVYAMPLLGIGFGSWYLARNRLVSLPKSASDWIESQQIRLSRQFESVYGKYLLFLRKRAGAS